MRITLRDRYVILVLIALVHSLASQINTPTSPKSSEFPKYYFFSNSSNHSLNTAYTQPNTAALGANSDGLVQQMNAQSMGMMGYVPPSVPPSDPYLAHQFILNQYNSKQQSRNNSPITNDELSETLNEIHTDYENSLSINSANSVDIYSRYKQSFQKITEMLKGKTKSSYADANYYLEAAYGDAYLTYKEFKSNIKESADFIKQWMQQKNIPFTNQNIHYAIQQFMGDTLTLKINSQDTKDRTQTTIYHFPFKYDYEDYDGEKDYRNYFSSKCLATGTGQCRSMPIVYLMLCEALGVDGYLSFAPYHSFIKFKNKDGKIINYEPTSHWTISDKWYQDNLGVGLMAKTTGIYLDTLNRKQAIANSLVDLAAAYMLNTPNADTTFILNCLNEAEKYFPKKNNLHIYLAKSSLLYRQLERALRQKGLKDLNNLSRYPDTNRIYTRLLKNEESLARLGYQEMPREMYDEMIQHQTNKINSPDAKKKKSLFSKNELNK